MLDPDLELARDMGRFFDDPLGFVIYAWPWDTDKTLQVVELPSPWRERFNTRYGPDAWACEFLDSIGAQVREKGFDCTHPVAPTRCAISSGHGIGKSAMTAWLVNWIMSTRPYCKGVVTANTAVQLESKTWAEIAKWTKRSITGHWFNVSTGRGAMRMTHVQHPESWRVDAQTCREENSESFAGLHAATSTPFYIFDEASAVPDKIWEVAEGGMTDGEPMWFVFGNPTRNTGRFHACFNGQRHRWHGRQIDSRTVAITNKAQIDEWIADWGEDSDFVRVRVRGVFPRAGSLQFIARDAVDAAMLREQPYQALENRTAIMGVDVARFGDDQSVIRTRIGRDARTFEPLRFRELDTMQLAARVVEHVQFLRRAKLRVVVFVDGGGVGGGVVDRLRQLAVDVVEVQFGGKADDARKYANKRAEMWGRMREWLAIGHLAKDEALVTDLTGVEYGFNASDQILLESKESMKKRGLASPDDADALALTFAHPVPEYVTDGPRVQPHAKPRRDYDPYELVKPR